MNMLKYNTSSVYFEADKTKSSVSNLYIKKASAIYLMWAKIPHSVYNVEPSTHNKNIKITTTTSEFSFNISHDAGTYDFKTHGLHYDAKINFILSVNTNMLLTTTPNDITGKWDLKYSINVLSPLYLGGATTQFTYTTDTGNYSNFAAWQPINKIDITHSNELQNIIGSNQISTVASLLGLSETTYSHPEIYSLKNILAWQIYIKINNSPNEIYNVAHLPRNTAPFTYDIYEYSLSDMVGVSFDSPKDINTLELHISNVLQVGEFNGVPYAIKFWIVRE